MCSGFGFEWDEWYVCTMSRNEEDEEEEDEEQDEQDECVQRVLVARNLCEVRNEMVLPIYVM